MVAMNLSQQHDPIVAIATAPGRAAVGIVRISGRGLSALARTLCQRPLKPREATYTAFLDGSGSDIDHGLAIYFEAPHSFTGEDVLELQAHGGPVVMQLLMARCLEAAAQTQADGLPVLAHLRLAMPGEFSLRAYLNDKMDLVQAEAIADLIDASTEAAVLSASRSLSGAFSREIAQLQKALVQLRTQIEATLDFSEEEIDFLLNTDAREKLSKLEQCVDTVLRHSGQGVLLRDGMTVVIAGQTNVGKSSLLNILAGAELAIVTAVPGTTRDKIVQTIQIQGVPVHVIDTAGLRDSHDEVEQLGMARTWEAMGQADAVLLMHDLTRMDATEYKAADAMLACSIAQKIPQNVSIIDIWNKVDAVTHPPCVNGLLLSAKTGQGLDVLRLRLLQAAGWQGVSEGVNMARQRHVNALQQVKQHLAWAQTQLAAQVLEMVAEELRLAHNMLCEITGEFSSDDLLGVIFSQFCIGK